MNICLIITILLLIIIIIVIVITKTRSAHLSIQSQEFQLLESKHLTFLQLLQTALQRNGLDPGLVEKYCAR